MSRLVLSSSSSDSPHGVGVDVVVEPQDVEAEEAHDEGVDRGHQPGHTHKVQKLLLLSSSRFSTFSTSYIEK